MEASIREIARHPDTQQVRDLCGSLIRQNFYQQALLNAAIKHISELELVVFLGQNTSSDEMSTFIKIANDICLELGIDESL